MRSPTDRIHSVQRRWTLARSNRRTSRVEVSGVSIPVHEVGGDLLEVIPLGDDRVAVYVADVVGKGAPASLSGARLKQVIRKAATDGLSPREICARVNGTLCDEFEPGWFATAFFAILDRAAGRLFYACAGHLPALLSRRDGTVTRLTAGGGILGAFAHLEFAESEIELKDGDRLLVYTDGTTEATDARGRELGEAGLADLLEQHRELDAPRLQQTLLRALQRFSRGRLRDDLTLGVLAVRARGSEELAAC